MEDLIENPYMLSLYDAPVSSKYGKSSHEIPRVGFDKVKQALSIYAPDKDFSSYQAQAAVVEQVRQAFENGSSYSELSEAVLNVQSPDIVLNDDGTVQLKVVNEMERDISQAVSAVWNKKTVFSGKYIQWGEILSDTGIQEEDRGFIEKQDALYAMQKKKLFFISGRAGTGKTTLVLSYLKGLTGKGIITQNDVMLLAPTGKAADRLKTVTGFQARTIASVLYENGWYVSLKNGFLMKRRNGGKKVRKRIIIVDESSMIDMASFRAVLSTVDLSYLMQVIFVGDKNQLPPVGAGKVFSQLIHELPGNLFELKVVNRFDDQSPQSGLARAVLEGTSKTGMDFSSFAKKYSSVRELGSLILEQISQYEKKREEWIILTPNNIGSFGVNALNLMIKKSIFGYDIKGYNLNERVILLENLPERKVYNGQIGYVEKVFDPFQDEFYIQVSFENGIKANFG
ncbi:MAG TPA: AAA family ATPase, partial [Petrotogaceae bacterium]|nr:AAA family ATPase [Petrotogaceae bacterium]